MLVFPLFFRKILRLVKHTLVSVSGVRDQEMALLDEMLAACAREASNKSLELIFSSHLFYQNRQEKFISSLAGTVHWEGWGHIQSMFGGLLQTLTAHMLLAQSRNMCAGVISW